MKIYNSCLGLEDSRSVTVLDFNVADRKKREENSGRVREFLKMPKASIAGMFSFVFVLPGRKD